MGSSEKIRLVLAMKTLKNRHTILAFPRINIKPTQKPTVIQQEKIFSNI